MGDIYEEAAMVAGVPENLRPEMIAKIARLTRQQLVEIVADAMHEELIGTSWQALVCHDGQPQVLPAS